MDDREGEEVYKLGDFNIIKDYIPHPNFIIDDNLFLLSSQIQCQIKGLTVPEKGPYISKLYGKLREEIYQDFEKSLMEYPENKKKEYIMKFYKDVDVPCQELFEKEFNLREIYRQSICEKEARRASVLNLSKENSSLSRQSQDSAEALLSKDIEELSIDWYVLIEKIVDILIKCQLYGVKKGCIYRDLSSRIKKQWWQTEKLSWRERLASNWNSSFRPLKEVFKKPKGDKMLYAEAMDCSDILVLVNWAACGEIVAKFFKLLRRAEDDDEFLANIKGFLLLVTQNLSPLLEKLEDQFQKCLKATTNKDLLEKQKALDILFNDLVNLRENVCVFEIGFLSEKNMFSRHDSFGSQRKLFIQSERYISIGVGSGLANSMKMNRKLTDNQGDKTNNESLRIGRSRSFHNPSIGFDFP